VGRDVWHRRQLRRIGLTALAVVLGVGVWQGVAGATATGGKTVKIQRHNANCGRPFGKQQIGTATFQRDGGTISVDVDLTNADPDTSYLVNLYTVKDNGGCKFLETIDELETDGAGMAHGEYPSQVGPKSGSFFVDLFEGGCEWAPTTQPFGCAPQKHGPDSNKLHNQSLIVNL